MKINKRVETLKDVEGFTKFVLPVLIQNLPLALELSRRLARDYSLFALYDAKQKKLLKVWFDKAARASELPENEDHVIFTILASINSVYSADEIGTELQKTFLNRLFSFIFNELSTGELRKNYRLRRENNAKLKN